MFFPIPFSLTGLLQSTSLLSRLPRGSSGQGDAVALSFKLRGISLESLAQTKPLMKAVKKALRAGLAQECGQGVGTEHVAVSLSEGSVIVDANIWPPPSMSCAFVKDRLKSSSTFVDTIQTWVNEVPNLEKIVTSPVRVSRSSISVSIIRGDGEDEAPPEDPNQAGDEPMPSQVYPSTSSLNQEQPLSLSGMSGLMADAKGLLEQERKEVQKRCKELQDCLLEAEQDVTALKSELETVKSRYSSAEDVTVRIQRSWAHLVAMATCRWCIPTMNLNGWSLRIRTVLAGSALASIKFDSEADEIAASTYRKAQTTWKWGKVAAFLVHRQVIEAHRDAVIASDQFRRALMSWARLVTVISRSQAERESWVIQAWARLASMLELVDVRGHQCSHKSDDALRHWPRIADLLLARVVADGWRLGSTRVCQRHSVLRRWGRLASCLCALCQSRQTLADHQEAYSHLRLSQASISWARLVRKLHDGQCQREHFVLQSWARLVFWLFRSQRCKKDVDGRHWPRMTELLLARHVGTGWRSGVARACKLQTVLGHWGRLAHQVHAQIVHQEAQDAMRAKMQDEADGELQAHKDEVEPEGDKAQEDPQISKSFSIILNWIRLTMALLAGSNDLLRDVGTLFRRRQQLQSAMVQRRQQLQSKQVQAMQDALQRQTSQALVAHQMLFDETQRTLAHCKRFQNHLIPLGLEEQCQKALLTCQQLLGLSEPENYSGS